jgi:hypothetical protein
LHAAHPESPNLRFIFSVLPFTFFAMLRIFLFWKEKTNPFNPNRETATMRAADGVPLLCEQRTRANIHRLDPAAAVPSE